MGAATARPRPDPEAPDAPYSASLAYWLTLLVLLALSYPITVAMWQPGGSSGELVLVRLLLVGIFLPVAQFIAAPLALLFVGWRNRARRNHLFRIWLHSLLGGLLGLAGMGVWAYMQQV